MISKINLLAKNGSNSAFPLMIDALVKYDLNSILSIDFPL